MKALAPRGKRPGLGAGTIRKTLRCAPLFVLVCGCAAALHSQPRLYFERVSLEHGLSQSAVRVIHQDSKGFLWFGAQDGLNKYDGYHFTVYKYDPFDSTSLSENDIWSIYEAPSEPEALWIGTGNGGLNRFDRETETFRRFRSNPADPTSLSHDFVGRIHEDRAENLWVITGIGLDRLDRRTGKFTRYRHDPHDANSLSHNQITAFHESLTEAGVLWLGTPEGLNRIDAKAGTFLRYRCEPQTANSLSFDFILSIFESEREPGVLWIGTGNPQPPFTTGGGLNRLELATGTFTHYRHDPANRSSISSDVVGPMLEDDRGRLWLGTAAGLDQFDRRSGTFRHFQPNAGRPDALSHIVMTLQMDTRGYLWMRTPLDDGVHRFDPNTGRFVHCQFDALDPRSLSLNAVRAIHQDRSGVLWFGTEAGGLNKLDYYAEKFIAYAPQPQNANSLSSYTVRALHEDRFGLLWIGVAQGGLNRLDRTTDTFKHYRHDPDRPHSLSNDNVWSIYEDHGGRLWVGSLGGGLNEFDRQRESFRHYRRDPADPASLSNDNVRVIYEDRFEPNVLWVGTDGGGLNRFELQNGTFTSFRHDPNDSNSLSNDFVRAIHQDQTGALWLGTAGGGLNRFDFRTKSVQRYRHEDRDSNSLGGNLVQSLYEDEAGRLWLGTYGGGLSRFDPASGRFTVYTEDNSGLINNAVYATLPDAHGNLWMSTNAGVCRLILSDSTGLTPATARFQSYDVDDGLQSREFNGQAHFKNRKGEMFFGGISGFNVFHPDSVKDNPIAPQLALTDFKLFNESVPIGGDSPLRKHISETAALTLAHWQNDISFDFVALHYSRPANNQYVYMLENYDAGWRKAGALRTATYTNLDPGSYTFRVKGSNNDGVWNETGIALQLTITPPWWRTPAAYVTYALALLAGLVAVERLHRTRLLRKERERAHLREAEFRAQTAELRAQAIEAQARAMQAENERKTHELEEARKLQLSMLPKVIPALPHLEIAVYTQTANEVGGDYYDFKLHEDGSLTAAIGDATGHGLQAGTMVAATKSLFNSLAHLPHPVPILAEASQALRGMGFHNMYMAMTIAKFKDHHLHLAAAGMPCTLIYRAATRRVEEVELKSLPLGSRTDVVYPHQQLGLNGGDTILFMSDGLPERFNAHGEMLGEERARRLFAEVGALLPQQIIDHLVDAARYWGQDHPQNDDITLVVVKVK